MPSPVDRTIPVTDLIRRSHVDSQPPPRDLVDWLVARQLAIRVGDRVAPTQEGRRIGAGPAEITRDNGRNR